MIKIFVIYRPIYENKMGRLLKHESILQDFTIISLANRELIISMLKHEDTLFLGPGQELYRNQCYLPSSSIEPLLAIQRKVLNDFGFKNDPASLDNYRKIVQVYWRGPDDYDAEVLQSVVYLRANKLLYYKTPVLENGSPAKDCRLINLDGTETSLSEHWKLNSSVGGAENEEKNIESFEEAKDAKSEVNFYYELNGIKPEIVTEYSISKQRVLVCAFSGS